MGRVYAGSYVPEQLQGSKRIPETIIGFELEVFSHTNLYWHPRRDRYVVPGGKLEQLFSADIGDLIADFALSDSSRDGFSYVDGKARFPGNSSQERKFLLPLELREIEQYARLVLLVRPQELVFNLTLRKDSISVQQPLEFRITQYRLIDGKMKERERESVVPWFRKLPGENLPDPKKVVYMVNSEVTNQKLN